MSSDTRIIIHQLSYLLSSGKSIFSSLDLVINKRKVGLIGENGIGKSTLLKIIAGELKPLIGTVETQGKVAYLSQCFQEDSKITVATFLGVQAKLHALEQILQGDLDESNFTILNDDWSIKDRIKMHLAEFNLASLELQREIKTLSGGEMTRLRLVKIFSDDAQILLLDEPTNNLDRETRYLLYHALAKSETLQLIVSHDRTLLSNVDEIIELTSLGVFRYGGNYQHYLEQKTIETSAKIKQLEDAKKHLHLSEQSIQSSYEKHEQRRAKGKKLRKLGKVDKLAANSAKGRSERSQRRLVIKKDQMLEEARQQVELAKKKVEIGEEIKVDLANTSVPYGKIVLKLNEVNFAYSGRSLFENFNLILQGPERIGLRGENGSGKTTLIKLILGQLKAQSGTIYCGVKHISYLDQQANLLLPELTLLDNFLRINPAATEQDAYYALAQFLFKHTQVLKKIENLSGGEKIRAALACILMSTTPPQLLILDEPTNHLDLKSIISLESILNCYQGALIVISHDDSFMVNIKIEKIFESAGYFLINKSVG